MGIGKHTGKWGYQAAESNADELGRFGWKTYCDLNNMLRSSWAGIRGQWNKLQCEAGLYRLVPADKRTPLGSGRFDLLAGAFQQKDCYQLATGIIVQSLKEGQNAGLCSSPVRKWCAMLLWQEFTLVGPTAQGERMTASEPEHPAQYSLGLVMDPVQSLQTGNTRK